MIGPFSFMRSTRWPEEGAPLSDSCHRDHVDTQRDLLLTCPSSCSFQIHCADCLGDGGFDLVIGDEEVVEVAGVGEFDLTLGGGEAALDGGVVLAATGLQAVEEGGLAGGEDEDGEGIRDLIFHLDRALDIDLEDDEAAAAEVFEDPSAGRAVFLAVDASGFEKLATGLHGFEGFVGDEVVIDAFDIGGGLGAGGGRDAEDGIGDAAFHAAGDGGFTYAAGPADDEEQTVVGIGGEAMCRAIGHGRASVVVGGV